MRIKEKDDKDDVRDQFLRTRVSKSEKAWILKKIAAEFGEQTSFSDADRIMWGLLPTPPPGAPKGNKNKLGKRAKTKK